MKQEQGLKYVIEEGIKVLELVLILEEYMMEKLKVLLVKRN